MDKVVEAAPEGWANAAATRPVMDPPLWPLRCAAPERQVFLAKSLRQPSTSGLARDKTTLRHERLIAGKSAPI